MLFRGMKNVLITGTPGTGKSTLSQMLIADLNSDRDDCIDEYVHLNVSEIIKDKALHDGYNEDYDTFILNEDKLLDYLEDEMKIIVRKGFIVDFHTADFFPEDYFDLIVVLRSNTNSLYDRLEERGYSKKKLEENIQAEIMQVVLEEVYEYFDKNKIIELQSNTTEDLESNLLIIKNSILDP